MSSFATFTYNTVIILVVTCIITVQCFTMTTDGKCDKGTHGKLRLYENKNGDDEVLVCAKKSGNYQWKFLDGRPSLGEKFDPANSCSDIVDNKPNPTDDYYWVRTEDGQVVKVWCDVHTDGGGFMLVGVQDNPSLWNVSFKNRTINPSGPSQWSSYFGNLPINEFAVQISENQNFDGTKAHWLYRFNSKRQLGNLLGVGSGGCNLYSGIGDVQYVKDILTNTVVTTTFNCSKFGHFTTSQLGWGRMNKCLKEGCSTGFAYLPGVHFQLDNFGSFSYNTDFQFSGITHSSTAFVGCDNKKCCACFGPEGGRGNYCGTKCRPINGGTVLQDTWVWFWIRTTVPKRVWRRCMEFQMKSEKGNLETHFIDRTTGSTQKGACSDHFHTFLNEGTLSVSKKTDLENVPPVAGLFSYCKENKSVFVNDGSEWNDLADRKEVEKLQARIKTLEETTRVIVNEDSFRYSSILSGLPRYRDFLLEWLPRNASWEICWRASENGWQSTIFHQRCDNKGPTVTIIKVGIYIFGGYTDVSWGGSSGYRRSTKSFIFSLKNKDNLAPFKAPEYRHYQYAIFTNNDCGPTFGGGHDIYISNNAHTSTTSITNFGHNYKLPSSYSYGSSNTLPLLAGSYHFQPSEIEVFFQR